MDQLEFTQTSLEPTVRKILETGWNGVSGSSAGHVYNVIMACVDETLFDEAMSSMDAQFKNAVLDLDAVIEVSAYMQTVQSAILDAAEDYGFSVVNFNILQENNALDMLGIFYSDLEHGVVVEIHKASTYLVVEARQALGYAKFFPRFINQQAGQETAIGFTNFDHAFLAEISPRWNDVLIKLVS